MSKELEALEKINHTICLNSPTIKWSIDEYDHIDCKDEKEFVKCYNIIEQALERNEPMKVKEALICDDPRIIVHHCPNCDKELFKTDISYCPCCGQKLDWRNNYE